MPTTVPALTWSPEQIKRFWDWHASRPEGAVEYFSAATSEAITKLLRLLQIPVGRYLDYGCGRGHLLRQMAPLSTEFYGADNSPETVARVNAHFIGAPRWRGCIELSGLPSVLADESFDLVTCLEVIEHLDDTTLGETLDELARVLAAGGYIVVSTPCSEDLNAALCYCPVCESVYHRWQHLQSFSPDRLEGLLCDRGLDVLFCRGINLLFLSPDSTLLKPFESPWSWMKLLAARVFDRLIRPTPSDSAEAKQLLRPGPHLVAVARKPSAIICDSSSDQKA